MARPTTDILACRWCGRVHRPVTLNPGERALCADCGGTLLRRPRQADGALAFIVTALICAVPAAELPWVMVRKIGMEHISFLGTGIRALWLDHLPLIAVWVAICGAFVPLALLLTLLAIVAPMRFQGAPPRAFWLRAAHALQRWSMPEVQVLAVLVAFVKIGSLVDVDPGPGLWFYGAMALATLLGWRSAEVREVVT